MYVQNEGWGEGGQNDPKAWNRELKKFKEIILILFNTFLNAVYI